VPLAPVPADMPLRIWDGNFVITAQNRKNAVQHVEALLGARLDLNGERDWYGPCPDCKVDGYVIAAGECPECFTCCACGWGFHADEKSLRSEEMGHS